jgi:hypothetical protein
VAAATLIQKIARRLAAESGTALIFALSIMGSLAIGGASMIYYTSQNIGASGRSSNDQSAMQLAESGLNDAYSLLYNASDPMNAGDVPQHSLTVGAGSVTYSGTLSGTRWTLTGSSSIVNPTGPGSETLTRTVTAAVDVVQSPLPDFTVWHWDYSNATSGCMNIANNAVVSAPLYVRGNLCLGNNSQVNATVMVGGTLTINNGAHIGTAGSPVPDVEVAGGCTKGGLHACSAADGIYANQIGSTPPSIPMPAVSLPTWYQNSEPGPAHSCTTGSFPGGFDNDGVENGSRADANLTPASAYDCQFKDGSGNLLGRITWTPGNPGTLIVDGTIYIDGNVNLPNNANVVYSGRATIYATGTVTLNNNAKLCGIANCTASWDPNTNLIVFVAGATSGTGFTLSQNSTYQGAAYVSANYMLANNATNWGPVIGGQLTIINNAGQMIPLNSVPQGTPVNSTETTTLQHVIPSWTG